MSAALFAGSTWRQVVPLIIAVAFLLMIALVCRALWQSGWDARDMEARNEAAHARIKHLDYLLKLSDHAQVVVGDYVLRRGKAEVFYRTIRQEIPRVVTVYKSAPHAPVQDLPDCVFTRGFVRVWNDALAGPLPAGDATGGTAEATAAADPAEEADLLDAGIGQAVLLENHVANSEVNNVIREQLEALRAFHNKAPMP